MRRRALLGSIATGAAAVLAGCGHPPPGASLRLESVTGENAAFYARSSDQVPTEFRPVAVAAAEDGSATWETDRSPLLRDGEYYRHEGTFYRVRTTLTATRTEEGYRLLVEYLPGDTTVEGEPPTADFESLPTADREAMQRANLDGMIEEDRRVGAGLFVQYGDAADDSRLLESDRVVVTYRGEQFLVRNGGRDTVERRTFRYETTPVADSPGAFASTLVDEYAFTLQRSALSEKQRSILREAQDDDEYSEESPISQEFQALIDRLREHEPLEPVFPEVYVLTYEGTDYFADVTVIGPNEDGPGTRTSRPPYRTPEGGTEGTTDGATTPTTTDDSTTPTETPPPTDY